MWNLKFLLIVGVLVEVGTAAAMPICQGDWEYQAQLIDSIIPENGAFETQLTNDLGFRAILGQDGLRIEMRTIDDQSIPIRKISQGVAPVRGSNPLLSRFGFGPDVLDPALNPELIVPGESANAVTVEPSPGFRGQVWVIDNTANTVEGTWTSNRELRACVRWTYWPRTPDTEHYPSPDLLVNFPSWVVMAFEECGLPKSLLLVGRMPKPEYRQRAWLEPDLDGDGLYDLVSLVKDSSTGRTGLAVCSQASRHLQVLGLNEEQPNQRPSSDFLSEIDWWSVDGRTVVLGIERAGSQKLYRRKNGALHGEWVGD